MSNGFKEWTLICEALGRGDQSIILRKGGIAEGREGFHFKHDEFFLFPTLFHEQVTKTKLPPKTKIPETTQGIIEIKYLAKVEWTEQVTHWEKVIALASFHLWQESVVKERFIYDGAQGLNLALVRVFKLKPTWNVIDLPAYGGCRSWITLPEVPPHVTFEEVINDSIHAKRVSEVKNALKKTVASKPCSV